jgi:hypothetical protein
VRQIAAGQPDGRDHALVEIVWSASLGGGEPVNRTLRLELARSSTAVSRRGLSSLDCPNCGGPLAESDAVKCTYCGEVLSGGKSEWALGPLEEVA